VRILLLDGDADFVAALTGRLETGGDRVQHVLDEAAPPDVVIIGLPAPLGLAVDQLRDLPLLLLVEGSVPFGELEAWIGGRKRWALLSKPVRDSSLELALARITRTAEPESDEAAAALQTATDLRR
jgi:hypothetical protein